MSAHYRVSRGLYRVLASLVIRERCQTRLILRHGASTAVIDGFPPSDFRSTDNCAALTEFFSKKNSVAGDVSDSFHPMRNPDADCTRFSLIVRLIICCFFSFSDPLRFLLCVCGRAREFLFLFLLFFLVVSFYIPPAFTGLDQRCRFRR